jgi:ABC-type lipoprotein export system ATPase subunit
MKITFNNVIPNPMKGEQFSTESVWGNSCELDSSFSYFLKSGSGKGKSTFSAYIMGLRSDYSGTVSIDGKNQKEISLDEWSDLRQNKLAFLAQDMRLFPNMTLIENLLIKNNLTNFKTESEINILLQALEMDHKKSQMAGTLSLGQQQRVALIRSLLQPFELLLMDEPFSHIDEANIDRALKIILEECQQQKAGYIMTSLGSNHGIENNKTILL